MDGGGDVEGRIVHAWREQDGPRRTDREILGFAAVRSDVASRDELAEFGLTRGEIDRRIGRGFLTPLYHGVYAVGRPAVTEQGRWRGAVLACGPGAVLSHWHAAALWGMWKGPGSRVHVSAGRSHDGVRGIVLHRPRLLAPVDRTVRRGIAVTSPARTLVDLAALASPRALRTVAEDAVRLELVDRASLNGALARHPGRRGIAQLRAIAAEFDASTTRTRSRLEMLYLLLCRERGLPIPLINDVIAGIEVDAVFPDYRVVVELDSFGYHGTWTARQRDHRRGARLSAAGWELLRFDWEQVTGDRDTVAVATIAALRRGGWSAAGHMARGPDPSRYS